MSFRDWFVPDEIQSGASAASEMFRSITQTSHFWLKQTFAALIPLFLGMLISYYIKELFVANYSKDFFKDLVANILTLNTVLAGFIVTLMLFTGKTDGSDSLDIDQAKRYVSKIKYLFFSQALTLGVYILCILSCLSWLLTQGLGLDKKIADIAWVIVCGFLTLGLLRTLLLPLQIYEVHQFELEALLDKKYKEYEDSIK